MSTKKVEKERTFYRHLEFWNEECVKEENDKNVEDWLAKYKKT